jgi:hypothetical protein
MQPVLVHRLRFKSYDHLFVTNTANLIPLFSMTEYYRQSAHWYNYKLNALGNFNK